MIAPQEQVTTDPQNIIAQLRQQLNERTTERDAALAREVALADVLRAINASPGNLNPVFEAILEKAMRLCGATIGGIYSYDGQWFVPVALLGVTPAFAAFSAEHPVPSGPRSAPTRILETKRPAQIPDLADASLYTRGMVDLGGIRALLDVPLLNPDFSYAGSASGLRIWEKRCAATVSPRSEVCPDADRVYGEAIRI